jgi:crotonobetainyl-CoA:carnitine CoA-transferase CaiB-like acyl-CoA transferase
MTESNIPTSPVNRWKGPEANPNTYERQARQFWNAGGAILMPEQLQKLSAEARKEVEEAMEKAYGKRAKR